MQQNHDLFITCDSKLQDTTLCNASAEWNYQYSSDNYKDSLDLILINVSQNNYDYLLHLSLLPGNIISLNLNLSNSNESFPQGLNISKCNNK